MAKASRAGKRRIGAAPAAKRKRPAAKRQAAVPRQPFAVSHYREEDFQAGGLRRYAQYRDLGISDATRGMVRAHVIRMLPPCVPEEVSKRHYHDVEFQMIYVLQGWIKTALDGEGEIVMRQGSCWIQPPRIPHAVLDYSADCELLEIVLPADFATVALE